MRAPLLASSFCESLHQPGSRSLGVPSRRVGAALVPTHQRQRYEHINTACMDRMNIVERAYNIGIWICMGTALLLIYLLATSYSATARWSIDAATP